MTAPSQTPEAAGLEPCPFCGGEAWLNDYEAKYSDLPPKSRAPQCRSCGASLGYLTTPEKATEAWNRRVAAVSAQAAIDAEKAKVAELSDAVRIISEKAENAINEGFRHITRATAAEARADRLAKALMTARDYVSDAAEGHAWTASQVAELMRGNRPDNRQAGDDLASIDAALQQETQP